MTHSLLVRESSDNCKQQSLDTESIWWSSSLFSPSSHTQGAFRPSLHQFTYSQRSAAGEGGLQQRSEQLSGHPPQPAGRRAVVTHHHRGTKTHQGKHHFRREWAFSNKIYKSWNNAGSYPRRSELASQPSLKSKISFMIAIWCGLLKPQKRIYKFIW